MTHTTEPWHNSPLPEGVSHAVTVPLGTGGGLSGGPSGQTRTGPQDGDLQSGTDNGGHGRAGSFGGHGGAGSSEGHGRCKELRRPWWCRELRRPWQVVFHGRGLVPRPGHSSRNPFTPPKKKKFLGEVRGIRSPLGLDKQDSTWQDRKTLQGQTNRTGHPTGTRSPTGLAWKRRLPLGMTRSQGPLQGPSATASISTTGRQAAGMASAATKQGAACPRRVSKDKTDKTWLKCSCGHNKTQTRLSWPWRVDWIHGARVSGGWRAWVSGDPAGLSQRRAGGHWVRGGPVAWSPANGGPGGAATRELENQPAGLG